MPAALAPVPDAFTPAALAPAVLSAVLYPAVPAPANPGPGLPAPAVLSPGVPALASPLSHLTGQTLLKHGATVQQLALYCLVIRKRLGTPPLRQC